MYEATHFEMGDDTTYASNGIPSADAFYLLTEANRSHFPRFQVAWDDCRGAAVEHLLAAREAVEAMNAMEQETIHVEWGREPNEDGKSIYSMKYSYGPGVLPIQWTVAKVNSSAFRICAASNSIGGR